MTTINVPIQIRFADVDMAGHVHNAVYLHWFETARMALQERFIPAEHDWREARVDPCTERSGLPHARPFERHASKSDAWCGTIGNKSFDIRLCHPSHGR